MVLRLCHRQGRRNGTMPPLWIRGCEFWRRETPIRRIRTERVPTSGNRITGWCCACLTKKRTIDRVASHPVSLGYRENNKLTSLGESHWTTLCSRYPSLRVVFGHRVPHYGCGAARCTCQQAVDAQRQLGEGLAGGRASTCTVQGHAASGLDVPSQRP